MTISIFKEGFIRKRNFKIISLCLTIMQRIDSFFPSISVFFFSTTTVFVAEAKLSHCAYLLFKPLKVEDVFIFSSRRLFVMSCRLLVSPAELWERTGWRPPANHPFTRGSRERYDSARALPASLSSGEVSGLRCFGCQLDDV